jgi:hypothetical protein
MFGSGPGCSRRTAQTARSRKAREDSESFLTVTHPFHPLAGQRLRVLFERRYKPGGIAFCCEGGLAFCCEGGPAGSVMLPVAWTDRGEPAADRALATSSSSSWPRWWACSRHAEGTEVVDV